MNVFELTTQEKEEYKRLRAESIEANRVAQEAYDKSIAAIHRVQAFSKVVANSRNITIGTASGEISLCGEYIYGYVYGPVAE